MEASAAGETGSVASAVSGKTAAAVVAADAILRAGNDFFEAATLRAAAFFDAAFLAAFFATVLTTFFAAVLAPASWVLAPTFSASVFLAADFFTATFFATAFWTGAFVSVLAAAAVGAAAALDSAAAFFAAAFFAAAFFAAGFLVATFLDAAASIDGVADAATLDALPVDFFAAAFGTRAATADAGASGVGVALVRKLSRVFPASSAARNQAGRGPRPPHWLPWPSLYFAALSAAAGRVALAFFAARFETAACWVGTLSAAPEANLRSAAESPNLAIKSLILATAPWDSMPRCLSAAA